MLPAPAPPHAQHIAGPATLCLALKRGEGGTGFPDTIVDDALNNRVAPPTCSISTVRPGVQRTPPLLIPATSGYNARVGVATFSRVDSKPETCGRHQGNTPGSPLQAGRSIPLIADLTHNVFSQAAVVALKSLSPAGRL
jgi:hypothetical protein